MSAGGPLETRWRAAWPDSLAAWSAYVQLREPVFHDTAAAARRDGMAGEVAAIRLVDQVVMVNLLEVAAKKLEDLALPVLAHEIGHHVFVPANLRDNARMIAAIRRVLYGLPGDLAGLVANLYGDLHINDRLHRGGVAIADVYRKFRAAGGGDANAVWKVYTRAYERLWRLRAGELAPDGVTTDMDGDAALIARLVRHYAGDWLRGVRRFAAILYRWLAEDAEHSRPDTFAGRGLRDTRQAGQSAEGKDAVPDGLSEVDESESGDDEGFDAGIEDPLAEDAASARGRRRSETAAPKNTAPEKEGGGHPGTQYRQPFEYGDLLRALGLELTQQEITARYYRERALPHLIPFPARKSPRATEPMPEGYETWETTDPLEALDLLGTVTRSPQVIPGVTTVQRTYGEVPGSDPAKRPLDLDIYVDSSGSMPNPAVNISYLALAGAILALSALRAGARVQATLWSGAGQFTKTDGFVRDERQILGVIAGYLGDGTAFPLNVLRDTYADRKPDAATVHVVVISDDGVDTMLQADEKAIPGERTCRMALESARGGGTLVLNVPRAWKGRMRQLEDLGFRVHAVQAWEDLVEFARTFVRENYREV